MKIVELSQRELDYVIGRCGGDGRGMGGIRPTEGGFTALDAMNLLTKLEGVRDEIAPTLFEASVIADDEPAT